MGENEIKKIFKKNIIYFFALKTGTILTGKIENITGSYIKIIDKFGKERGFDFTELKTHREKSRYGSEEHGIRGYR